MTHLVSDILVALRDQTARRGGCPSVGNIEDAHAAVLAATRAYDALRDQLGTLVEAGQLDASAVMELELHMAALSPPTP